jgi:hypothetical protein
MGGLFNLSNTGSGGLAAQRRGWAYLLNKAFCAMPISIYGYQ